MLIADQRFSNFWVKSGLNLVEMWLYITIVSTAFQWQIWCKAENNNILKYVVETTVKSNRRCQQTTNSTF